MADYPSDWDNRRKKAYKRDNYQCQNCGRVGGRKGDADLHAHHVVPKSRNGTNSLSNLKTLCKPCHKAVHHKHKIAPSPGSDSNRFERQSISRRNRHRSQLSEPNEPCPLCGEDRLQISNQLIRCSRCESVFTSKWYGLKLKRASHRYPFRRKCPDCGAVSLNLQEEGTNVPQIVCDSCGLTLEYDRKYAVWSISTEGDEHSLHLTELDKPDDQGVNFYGPESLKGDSSDLNDLTGVSCPDCAQSTLIQEGTRIVICESCPAKFKSKWGEWKKIRGTSRSNGESRTVSEWRDFE